MTQETMYKNLRPMFLEDHILFRDPWECRIEFVGDWNEPFNLLYVASLSLNDFIKESITLHDEDGKLICDFYDLTEDEAWNLIKYVQKDYEKQAEKLGIYTTYERGGDIWYWTAGKSSFMYQKPYGPFGTKEQAIQKAIIYLKANQFKSLKKEMV